LGYEFLEEKMKKGQVMSKKQKKKLSFAAEGKSNKNKGKTYEEIYGIFKTKVLKEILAEKKRGKSYVKQYGEKKAKEIIINKRKNMIGKNREGMKELWKNDKYRRNMIAKHTGKKQSEKTKKKRSVAMLGFKHSEKTKEKMRMVKTKEHRENIIKGMLKYFLEQGGSKEPYSVDWTQTLKRAVRERDNYICQVCSKYGNAVHHIDYNKKNSNPDNLITLCGKCHAKTNHKRKEWEEFLKNVNKN